MLTAHERTNATATGRSSALLAMALETAAVLTLVSAVLRRRDV
ncbi:hypothetical protein [Streptomyces tibetensis]|uniref:Uncharacterized protein n=1 Tax=Streptomyces tibetensis TaxID=2382123 RepID=A0ABW6MZM9_9ACTN